MPAPKTVYCLGLLGPAEGRPPLEHLANTSEGAWAWRLDHAHEHFMNTLSHEHLLALQAAVLLCALIKVRQVGRNSAKSLHRMINV